MTEAENYRSHETAIPLIGVTVLLLLFAAFRWRRLTATLEAERRYKLLFENSVNGIMAVDVIFDEQGRPVDHRIMAANPVFEKLTGVPLHEQVGKTNATMPIRWPPEIVERFYRVAMTGEPVQYERFNTSIGRWFDTRVFSPKYGQFVTVFMDITDRKNAELALKKSETRYSAFSDKSLLGVFSVDGGRFTYVNSAGAEIFGRTQEELLNIDPLVMVHPDDHALVSASTRNLVEGVTESTTYEFRGVHGDGTIRYLQAYGVRVPRDDGPATIIGNVVDITERRLTENALRDSEENYRRIVETSSEGIWMVDLDFRTTYVNRRMEQMLGCLPGGMLGRHVTDFLPEEELESHRRQIADRLAGKSSQYERRLRRTDGTLVDTIASVVPVLDERGSVRGAFGMFTDVTGMKFADRQVRRLAITVEQLAEAILILDTRGTIEYANPAFERMTGYSRTEVIGKSWSFLKSPYEDEAAYQTLWRTIKQGDTWQGVTKNARKDGVPFESEGTVSPVRDSNGTIVNFVGIARDVTKERVLAERLHQSQKMEAIGTLAGGIAHDFNNLLQGMMMMLKVVQKTPALPDRAALLVAKIETLAGRGASLTKQLLLFSRKDVARPESLDLNDIIRQASTLLRRLIRENVDFRIDGLSAEPLPVTVDLSQLEQALVNLVVNAADAMPGGGEIRISSGLEGDRCWFSIDDTGHGIPAAIRERVFEPFFTTKGREKGTGLGLSVVHGIVLEHDGTVTFEDRPGGGTRFLISLPRTADAEGATLHREAPEAAALHGKGERVLVIEDEEAVRTGLVEMLRLLNYEVVDVSSGEEALLLPVERSFDAALSDVVLSGMSGSDTVQRLQQRWPVMKAILMSGYTSDEELRQRVASGKVMLLQKPFEISTLSIALRGALDVA